jgi:hypothetical protein
MKVRTIVLLILALLLAVSAASGAETGSTITENGLTITAMPGQPAVLTDQAFGSLQEILPANHQEGQLTLISSTEKARPSVTSVPGSKAGPTGGLCVAGVGMHAEYDQAEVHTGRVVCNGDAQVTGIQVTWYEANVNTPSTFVQVGQPTTWRCSMWNNYCGEAHVFYSHTITRTSLVRARVQLQGEGVGGPWYATPVVYNDRGWSYPEVIDTRYASGGYVPFRRPGRGWGMCEDTGLPGRCDADQPRFRSNLQEWYINRQRPLPRDPYEAHHIAPQAFGGGDLVPANGVLINRNTHQWTFTPWWAAFSIRTW